MLRGVLSGAVAVAFAVGMGMLFWVGGPEPADEPEPPEWDELDSAERDRHAEEAAKTLIAVESRTANAVGGQSPAVEPGTAPPGFNPLARTAREPVPPAGYAFAARHEVKRAPMTAADFDRVLPRLPDWMMSGEAILAAQAASHGRGWTYGWVKLADASTIGDLREVLEVAGGEVLGQAGDLVRARLPGDAARLRTIATAQPVAGVGALPARGKVTSDLAERALANAPDDDVPVWITLMDGDADGRWRAALVDMGAEVGRFDPTIRTYAATLPLGALERVAAADFVLGVETIRRLEPALEFATAAMGADAVRAYDESTGLFAGVGGASVPVGVMDTGLNVGHPAIATNRRSICGVNFTVPTREQDQDLWFDADGHGTAVAGVVLGNGVGNPSRAGMAPLVRDIRFAKVLGVGVNATSLGFGRAMDWLARPTECGDGVPRKALVVNASVGSLWIAFDGRSTIERKVDATVWTARQLFVAAAGNEGTNGRHSAMAVAKNTLSVGATDYNGDIAGFSSRGPTYDGRLLPHVVAPGVRVTSTDGAGRDTYVSQSGTSFAAPAVAGVAALVMDAIPGLREEPAALRAHLMAGAIRPAGFLEDTDGFRRHNTDGPGRLQNVYGLGKVSARTAVLTRDDDDGWTVGAVAFDADADSYAYHDVVVPPGSSRLDVVLSWDEPPAELIVTPVLHDLDLWVDPHASCGSVAKCGRYASRSRTDNVEWLILRNPTPGVYRVKALPNRIHGAAPRAGMAWKVVRGDSTPTLAVELDAEQIEVTPNEDFDVAVTVSSDGYVAAGTRLRVDCRAMTGTEICHDLELVAAGSSYAPGEDGTPRGFDRIAGTTFPLGEVGPDERQSVTLRLRRGIPGSFRLHFTASGWNARGGSGSVGVVVGMSGYEPPPPTTQPANDRFDAAIHLDDTEGETTFDLQFATFEAGEPMVSTTPVTPASRPRSLWYTWTADDSGLVRFTIAKTTADDYSETVFVGVYEGEAPTALVPVGSEKLGGAATFFAQAGRTYRIRLGLADWGLTTDGRHRSTPTMTLSWGPGSRPANDAYAQAAPIAGETGSVDGNNQAATTEPDELIGFANPRSPAVLGPTKTASVWYRWTAPSTGDWRFRTNRGDLVVSAYMGKSVAAARLASGVPDDEAVFPAQAGQEYRISVASPLAYLSGGEFTLEWGPGARSDPGNDDFAASLPLDPRTEVEVDFNSLTVESAEPAATGVRTAWFSWQPPNDGRYTAFLEFARWWDNRWGEVPYQLSAFEGDALESLRPLGVHDASRGMRPVVAFDGRADAPHRIALGLARGAAETPLRGSPALALEVGETPPNDDLANAQALSGSRGSVTGSTKFATIEAGEQTGESGGRSVWYTYRTEESGWVRFDNPRLQGLHFRVYRRDGFGGLELVAIGREVDTSAFFASDPHPTHVTFHAEAGVEYVLRLSINYYGRDGFGGRFGGDFEVTWGPSYPPAQLRYVQAINDFWNHFTFKEGTIDPYDFGIIGDMVSNGEGTEIYVASDLGLMVFERDADTGMLAPLQTLADHPIRGDHSLHWDSAGSALLVAACNGWKKFTPVDGGGLAYAGDIANAPCPEGELLLHGSFMHQVNKPWLIETYEFDADHASLAFADALVFAGIDQAAMTADGSNLYAVAVDGEDAKLLAIARDVETGGLSITAVIGEGSAAGDGAVVPELKGVTALALQAPHLFLALGDGKGGTDTMVFDLADRSNPVFQDFLPAFAGFHDDRSECDIANAWTEAIAMEMFCSNFEQFYVVQVNPDGALVPSDYSRNQPVFRFQDAYGNLLPRITHYTAVTPSPDGRHVYLAGTAGTRIFAVGNEVHVFERVYGDGSEDEEERDAD
ncbi:MAG: S8 family serine peptidase [Gammaproteobacteria bacterium]|nr:S8 family serine peptidase [Gammaproteobacteria bacterium]